LFHVFSKRAESIPKDKQFLAMVNRAPQGQFPAAREPGNGSQQPPQATSAATNPLDNF